MLVSLSRFVIGRRVITDSGCRAHGVAGKMGLIGAKRSRFSFIAMGYAGTIGTDLNHQS